MLLNYDEKNLEQRHTPGFFWVNRAKCWMKGILCYYYFQIFLEENCIFNGFDLLLCIYFFLCSCNPDHVASLLPKDSLTFSFVFGQVSRLVIVPVEVLKISTYCVSTAYNVSQVVKFYCWVPRVTCCLCLMSRDIVSHFVLCKFLFSFVNEIIMMEP